MFEILVGRKLVTIEQLEASSIRKNPLPQYNTEVSNSNGSEYKKSQIFIFHGHGELAELELVKFISGLNLEPIVLHMQASSGRTIIEKIELYSNVGFGIVLYTPCDVGSKVGELNGQYRARQNVVFEHGYLIGKLGRSRVSAIVKDRVEIPNDISGVVYILLDDKGCWKEELKKEMRSVGYSV